jgi:hypothetical protein
LVVGVETGGAITGLAKTLKAKIPGLKVVGVEPEHSSIQDGVNRSSAWKVEDIGGNFTPSILDKSLVDVWIKVSDQESYSTARQIIREEGLFCGKHAVPLFPTVCRLFLIHAEVDRVLSSYADHLSYFNLKKWQVLLREAWLLLRCDMQNHSPRTQSPAC